MSTFEKAIKEWEALSLDIELCTCNECKRVNKCSYAYDIYNYDGDCIMEK